MNDKIRKYLEELIERYPKLESEKANIERAFDMLNKSFGDHKKVLIAGNGGSAADAEHIVGELMKSFLKNRKLETEMMQKLISVDEKMGKELADKLQGALPAIALCDQISLSTAYLNDVDPLLGFAQQVSGYGNEGDVFWGISTSGNSSNVIYACITAKAKGMKVIGLTGGTGGKLKELADVVIVVPEKETYKIQEFHLPIYHTLCLMLEESFFGDR